MRVCASYMCMWVCGGGGVVSGEWGRTRYGRVCVHF